MRDSSPSHRSTALCAALLASLSGCYAAHQVAPELLECPASPYVGPRTLWRADAPARGRIWACEACAGSEEAIVARRVALGCRLRGAHDGCTLSGACDYAEHVGFLRALDAAETCEELDVWANEDPCARPDPRLHWRDARD